MSVASVKVGDTFTTNEGYAVEVLEYTSSKNVVAKFSGTDQPHFNTSTPALFAGKIKNPMHKSVFGKGFLGYGDYTCKKDGKLTEEYRRWHSMLGRCAGYDRYADIEKSWYNFQNFAKWFDLYKWKQPSWQLDKDILSPIGGKIYSSNTCCVVPKEINMFYVGEEGRQTDPTFGCKTVTKTGKYSAHIRMFNKNIFLGNFENQSDARVAYENKRKEYTSLLIEKWDSIIDPRVIDKMRSQL